MFLEPQVLLSVLVLVLVLIMMMKLMLMVVVFVWVVVKMIDDGDQNREWNVRNKREGGEGDKG